MINIKNKDVININRKGFSNNERIMRENKFENIQIGVNETQDKFIVVNNAIEIALTLDREEEYSEKFTSEELKQISYVLDLDGWIMDKEMLARVKAHLLAGGKINKKIEVAVQQAIKIYSNENKEKYAEEVSNLREEYESKLRQSKEKITKECIQVAIDNELVYTKNQTKIIKIVSFVAGISVTIVVGAFIVLICLL